MNHSDPQETQPDTPLIERVPIADLVPDDLNANTGTARGEYMIARSFERNGAVRGIALDKNRRIIGGNKSHAAAGAAGIDEVIVVHTNGRQLVAVQRDDLDLDSPDGRQAAIDDNRTGQANLNWNLQVLADLHSAGTVDLGDWWHPEELDALRRAQLKALKNLSTPDEPPALSRYQVPDVLWPSDNQWGIPTLDATLQASSLPNPITTYGSVSRKAPNTGTVHFYCEDYRYTALFDDPTPVVNAGYKAAVEPNFSIGPLMPLAYAIYQIYRKRWIARYWQSMGIPILVDLNVCEPHIDTIGLLGVPQGWRAYATHGVNEGLDSTLHEYDLACNHAGTDDILFWVYGGGKAAKDLAHLHGWHWTPEHMDRAKGRPIANGD